MLIRVDPALERPIYEQIAESVRAEIAAARLHPGDSLPPAREIAGSLEVNQHTVLRAYQLLRDEGLVDLRRGRGTVVTALAAAMAELAHEAHELARRAAALGVGPAMLAALIAGSPAAAAASTAPSPEENPA